MSDIVAIGGAAFSAEPRNLALDRYLAGLSGRERPRVLLIATARGDDTEYVAKFEAAYESIGARPSHLPFFQRTPDLRSLLLSQHVIFVGGGNTKSMLAVWREWRLPPLLQEASRAGIVLAGVSAGAICWFQQGVTDSWGDRLRALDGLGMLAGSCCPHYDGEAERRPAYHQLLRDGTLAAGVAIEDGVAVHFRNGTIFQVLTKRDGARAYAVGLEAGAVIERPLEAQLLAPV